jgi:hypothetical protein
MIDSLLFAAVLILVLAFAGGVTSSRHSYRMRRRH